MSFSRPRVHIKKRPRVALCMHMEKPSKGSACTCVRTIRGHVHPQRQQNSGHRKIQYFSIAMLRLNFVPFRTFAT